MEIKDILDEMCQILYRKNIGDCNFHEDKKKYAFFVSHKILRILMLEGSLYDYEYRRLYLKLGELYILGIKVYAGDMDDNDIYLGKKY